MKISFEIIIDSQHNALIKKDLIEIEVLDDLRPREINDSVENAIKEYLYHNINFTIKETN